MLLDSWFIDSIQTYRSSAKTWSNSDVDTRNKIDVTELKHVVHFCRCVRWPPTSTNTNGISYVKTNNWVLFIIPTRIINCFLSFVFIYLNFDCEFINTFCCFTAMQYIFLWRYVAGLGYSIDFIKKVTNWITLKWKQAHLVNSTRRRNSAKIALTIWNSLLRSYAVRIARSCHKMCSVGA